MSIEQQRKNNREKFPEFALLHDEGFKILWAKHIDGAEIGKNTPTPSHLVPISAECAIALSTFGSKK